MNKQENKKYIFETKSGKRSQIEIGNGACKYDENIKGDDEKDLKECIDILEYCNNIINENK